MHKKLSEWWVRGLIPRVVSQCAFIENTTNCASLVAQVGGEKIINCASSQYASKEEEPRECFL